MTIPKIMCRPPKPAAINQLLHAAGANYFFINIAKGEKPPAEETPSRSQYKTKADVIAFVKKSCSLEREMAASRARVSACAMVPSRGAEAASAWTLVRRM